MQKGNHVGHSVERERRLLTVAHMRTVTKEIYDDDDDASLMFSSLSMSLLCYRRTSKVLYQVDIILMSGSSLHSKWS